MASGSFGGGRGSGGRTAGAGGGRRRGYKYSSALARRTSDSYQAMNRKNRVRGERNATVKTSDWLPF